MIVNFVLGILNVLLIPVNIIRAVAGLPPIVLQGIILPKIPYLQTGGMVTKGGLFVLHPGEAVIPAGEAGANITNEFNINATIRSEADIYELARLISELQEDRYARGAVTYTT
jgi:hypothetical protein